MPYCQALNCKNRYENKDGKSFFRFPRPDKEFERLKMWLDSIGTGLTPTTFKWNKNKTICSDHFHVDCIEIDQVARTLGIPEKKATLKPDAVPTIFSYKIDDKDREAIPLKSPKSSKRKEKTTQAKVSYLMVDAFYYEFFLLADS